MNPPFVFDKVLQEHKKYMTDYNPSVDTNPKKQFGDLKAPFGFTPDTALIELEGVMAGGAHKYGAFNFRETNIDARTYIGAIRRHLALWADGEDRDEESNRSHLAHIMACCSLALDAQHTGRFEDNRSKTGLVGALLKKTAEDHNKFSREYDSKRVAGEVYGALPEYRLPLGGLEEDPRDF